MSCLLAVRERETRRASSSAATCGNALAAICGSYDVTQGQKGAVRHDIPTGRRRDRGDSAPYQSVYDSVN
jgi:hypothetical protein